jgi:hypothetical protein
MFPSLNHQACRIARLVANCLLTTTVLLLMSCGTVSPLKVAQETSDVNKAVEQNENDVTLLNIVRSYLREPRIYTDFTDFKEGLPTSTATFKLSATPEFDFGGQSASPTVDINPSQSQGFIRGITSPVSPTTVAYYSGQEWPNSLLLHLFVREIRVYSENGVLVKTYSNYPQATDGYDQFDALINGFAACDLSLDHVESGSDDAAKPDDLGPAIPTIDAATVKSEAAVAAANFKLVPAATTATHPTQYYLVKQKTKQVSLSLMPRGNARSKAICLSAYDMAGVPRPAPDSYMKDVTAPKGATTSSKSPHMSFVLRSPEAVMYYIGETARVQLDGAYLRFPKTHVDTKDKNAPQKTILAGDLNPDYARRIGVIHFSESCAYEPSDSSQPPCTTSCADLFVLNSDPSTGTTPKGYCYLPPLPPDVHSPENTKMMESAAAYEALAWAHNAEEFSGTPRLICAKEKTSGAKSGDPQQDCDVEDTSPPPGTHSQSQTVSYAKSNYWISGDSEADTETLHTLYLVEQLIELQANSTDAPSSNLVPIGQAGHSK